MTYLASLQYVSDLQMVTLEDDKLVVTMQIKGDKAVLTRTLAIDHVIEQESAAGTVDDVMHYRLLP